MGMLFSERFETMEDLFWDQLRDLYDAEHRLLDALPKMASSASSQQLKDAFETHRDQTEAQISRIEQIFRERGKEPDRKTCEAMRGLLSEGQDVIDAKAPADVKDAALIAAAQRVEHYEMAGYGSARTFAQNLGFSSAADLLQETLEEEEDTDERLTMIAEGGVNQRASMAREGTSAPNY